MLKIEGLTKTFRRLTAVNNVSFEVPTGQMLGVIGRSGAGKSTLLRMINRLTEPTAGKIYYDGRDVTALKGRELRLWRRAVRDDFPAVQPGSAPRCPHQCADGSSQLPADRALAAQAVHGQRSARLPS